MGVEKCSKCDSLLDGSVQAFVNGGDIVCSSCDQLLRDGFNILGADVDGDESVSEYAMASVESYGSEDEWDLGLAKKKRKLYLLFFVLSCFANVISMLGSPIGSSRRTTLSYPLKKGAVSFS